MVKSDYRRALRSAEREMIRLEHQKERVLRQIAQTRQTILALRTSVEVEGRPLTSAWIPTSLTESVKYVAMCSKRPLYGPEVRDRVHASGFALKSSNPLASVYSVLKRLIEQEEVRYVYKAHYLQGFDPNDRAFWWGAISKLPKDWVLPTQEEYMAVMDKYYPDVVARWKAKQEKKEKEE